MTDWNKLKVVDLKAELKKRGLPQTGLKPALIARLAAAENGDGSESEATLQEDAHKLDTNSPDTVSPTLPTPAVTFEVAPEVSQPATAEAPKPSAAPRSIPDEAENTVESSQVSVAAQNDQHTSSLPSVEPQEAIEDRQKRKRRSQSPPPSTHGSAKRYRGPEEESGSAAADFTSEVVIIPSDVAKEDTAIEDVPMTGVKDESEPAMADVNQDVKGEDVSMGGVEPRSVEPKRESAFDEPAKTRDSRQFKNLFSGDPRSTAMAISTSHDSAYEEGEPDRDITPALHPATSTLYIRDIMRPLNAAQFKSHVAMLAAPPGQEPDLDVVVNFYIDSIRTHAFVSFASTSAASRVRSALHDRIWPDEKTRKPLWIDFVPTDKLESWIEQEQDGAPGGRGSQRKWEVIYDIDQDRNVTAMLQEVSGVRPSQPTRKPSIPVVPAQPPLGPRRNSMNPPSGPRSFNIRGQAAPPNTDRLNEMFKSTTAKPMLYYQPVPKALTNKRFDAMDQAMSKDAAAGKRITGAINRYTFEDGDKLVDRGPEIFPGIKPPPRSHPGGPPGGGRGGPPRDRDGGFRGRGGGGQYRDYRDRAPGRTYESFRPGEGRDDRRY